MLCLALFIATPYFLTFSNFSNIFRDSAVIGIIAIAMTAVIVSGGIDLSVGSVVALIGVTIAQLSSRMPIGGAVAVALLVGILFGLFNGLAVTRVGINPLIATLGTLSIGRGLALIFSGGLSQSINSPKVSRFWGRAGRWAFRFPSFLCWRLFALAAWIMKRDGLWPFDLCHRRQPKRLAAGWFAGFQSAIIGLFVVRIGSNAGRIDSGVAVGRGRARRRAGHRTERHRRCHTWRNFSLSGGKGTIFGTLLGVLILGTLNNGLTLLSV